MMLYAENMINLDADQINKFEEDGYLILTNFIHEPHNQQLKLAVDRLIERRHSGEKPIVMSELPIGELVSHGETLHVLNQLFKQKYTMHHVHATRFDQGASGVNWHQDYEQYPQTNRSHLMVHVFYYLSGLNGEIGDLLCLPGSHKKILPNNLNFLGTKELDGCVRINDLPPGSAVIVHSALMHARDPKPGGSDFSRYFIDISYCEHGVKWPGYNGRNDYKVNFDFALKNGLDKEGEFKHLFDKDQFFDVTDLMYDFANVTEGSLLDGRAKI